ncbi:MAG TPA: twin-arginine translocase subunit TatC [Pirellulales bacterium]|nr:twin-arginine translocase subunit TatC [Pirellulales bacterium]
MAAKRDEDLFQDTTMTFGEHLEELRVALFKAVAGLAIGVAIGFFVGDWVVALIQRPLVKALGGFYETKSVKTFTEWSEQRKQGGKEVFYTVHEVKRLVEEDHFILEIKYIHPRQAWHELKQAEPEALKGIELPAREEAVNEPQGEEPGEAADDAEKAKKRIRVIASKASLTPIFLWTPVEEDPRIHPTALSVQEPFAIWLKASIVVGIVLSSPWVFFQIWSFVAAGLYPHEKKYVYRFLPVSVGLFLSGAAIAYLLVFEPVLRFLFSFNNSLGIDSEPRISEWLSFVLFLPLGFGISFQLPLVMLFLERIGVFSLKSYIEKWRIAVLVIFVLSAILTPADPISIFYMAIPLTVLYFGGMLLCRWMPRAAASED